MKAPATLAASIKSCSSATIALALMCVLSILLVCYPVFSDEILYKFYGRFFVDGWYIRFVQARCNDGDYVRFPVGLLPGFLAQSFLYGFLDSPFALRVHGICFAILIQLGIWRTFADVRLRGLWMGGILGLGLIPLGLILSRPEQILVICLIAATWISKKHNRMSRLMATSQSWFESQLPGVLIVFLSAIAVGTHAKALFLIPFFAACVYSVTASKRMMTIIFLFFCVIVYQATLFYTQLYDCSRDPVFAARFHSINLTFLWKDQSLPDFAAYAFQNMALAVFPLLSYFFESEPSSRTLFSSFTLLSPFWLDCVNALIAFCWTLSGLVWLSYIYLSIVNVIRFKATSTEFQGLALAAGLLLIGASQSLKNFYEMLLVMPAATISIMLMTPSLPKFPYRTIALISRGISRCAILSLALFTVQLLLVVDPANPSREILKSLDHLSFIPSDFDPILKQRVREGFRSCGFHPPEGRPSIIVDEVTYLPIQREVRPVIHHATDIALEGADTRSEFSRLEVRGAFVQCLNVAPTLRRPTDSSGQFCCMTLADHADQSD